MKTVLITFEHKEKDKVINALKRIGSWARLTDTCYLIASKYSCREIRDILTITEELDRLIVFELFTTGWASYNLPAELSDWMKEHIN